ncbi:hypothetical protein L580_3876 [Serratia fonticola AU-P3(3)]|nr:hypothetical protein L580_3876 [Serratia fonticola AU-P3(3)]
MLAIPGILPATALLPVGELYFHLAGNSLLRQTSGDGMATTML